MSTAGVLTRGRVAAEARMVDTCAITAKAGAPVFDDNTGEYTPAAPSSIYSGKCEVQVSDGLSARQTEAGGAEITVSRVTVKIPVSATGVRVGHLVTITAATNDPDLVDQKFEVIALHSKTYASARRLQVERVTA